MSLSEEGIIYAESLRIVEKNLSFVHEFVFTVQAVHTGSGWEAGAYWELCQGGIGVQVALLRIDSRGV